MSDFIGKGGDSRAILENLLDQIESTKQELHNGVLKYSARAMLLSANCLTEDKSAEIVPESSCVIISPADLANRDGKFDLLFQHKISILL